MKILKICLFILISIQITLAVEDVSEKDLFKLRETLKNLQGKCLKKMNDKFHDIAKKPIKRLKLGLNGTINKTLPSCYKHFFRQLQQGIVKTFVGSLRFNPCNKLIGYTPNIVRRDLKEGNQNLAYKIRQISRSCVTDPIGCNKKSQLLALKNHIDKQIEQVPCKKKGIYSVQIEDKIEQCYNKNIMEYLKIADHIQASTEECDSIKTYKQFLLHLRLYPLEWFDFINYRSGEIIWLEHEFAKIHQKVMRKCNHIRINNLILMPKCHRMIEYMKYIIKRLKTSRFCDENNICEEAKKTWESCDLPNNLDDGLEFVSIERCLGMLKINK